MKKGNWKILIAVGKKKTWQPWYSWKGIVKNLWKKGKRKLHDNLDYDKREYLKESDEIRKKEMPDNLDDDKREQMKESDKINKEICDNLDDNEKGALKNVDSRRKKEKLDNLDTH